MMQYGGLGEIATVECSPKPNECRGAQPPCEKHYSAVMGPANYKADMVAAIVTEMWQLKMVQQYGGRLSKCGKQE